MTTLADVALQIGRALGEDPPALVPDGKRRYFGAKKKSWYRLREMDLRSGAGRVVVGWYGNYKQGISERVTVDWKGLSQEQREHYQRQRDEAAARDRAERARLAAMAKMSAADLWRAAARTGSSAYLQRKGVEAEACRYLPDGSIVIPLLRYDADAKGGALQALQRIYPADRTDARTGEALPNKVFTRGFQKPRCALRLGTVLRGEPVLVCEGYATGLSIRMATARALPVFVALDAGNLVHVCTMLLELYPQHWLLICADDDWQTEGNPGRTAATKAAKALGQCDIVWPVFPAAKRKAKDTDFNDLHALCGLQAVARQIGGAVDIMRKVRLAA